MFSELLFIGLSGLALSTVAIPVLCALAALFGRSWSRTQPESPSIPRSTLAGPSNFSVVFVPTHNDADLLAPTLESIKEAISFARLERSIRLVVGVDGCSDRSREVALAAGAEVLESSVNVGKWATICRSVEWFNSVPALPEWIALVDCGVVWPREMLTNVAPQFEADDVASVAPTYVDERASMLGRLSWRFESALKWLEGLGRGPISVHGATVFYRYTCLKNAFHELGDRKWLNDDVVVPLMVRALHPGSRTIYLQNTPIVDRSPRRAASGWPSRRRMMVGNVEWIRLLMGRLLKLDKSTFFMAFRRIARVFWIYWIGFVIAGLSCLVLGSNGLIPTVVPWLILISTIICAGFLSPAAAASALAPFYFFTLTSDARTAQWR